MLDIGIVDGNKRLVLRGKVMPDINEYDYSYINYDYGYINFDNTMQIRIPKEIAKIKLCGGALTFTINDTMQFEMPTEEQCENLKKTFGIEVELIEDD